MARTSGDEQLADAVAEFYADPLGYVMFNFPWDDDPSIQMVDWYDQDAETYDDLAPYRKRYACRYGPDLWACQWLDDLGVEIRKRGFNGRDAVDPVRFSTASGHGIGKSTLSAWIIMFVMDTRPYSKGTVTANTVDQLKSKTWSELEKWRKRALTGHLYEYSSGRGSMALRRRGFEQEWFVQAQTCREENSEAFAGQHAANSTSWYLFDEASGIPDKIYEVREGGLSDGEPMVFDFGNPTQNTGAFFENTVGKRAHRYIVRQIDSRSVRITNKKKIADDIADWGIESDFIKVRVLGQFPSMGSTQFISTKSVEAAQMRDLHPTKTDPLVIGVDVARFGDDESVIYPRIGDDARSFAPTQQRGRYRGLDTVQLVGRVIDMVRFFRDNLHLEYSAIFVDGTGVGGGVVDQLRALGYNVVEVQFGSSPSDGNMYRFRSDEMWGRMREAIDTRLVLPSSDDDCGEDLYTQLTQRQFGYMPGTNKIHLEPKKDMKERLKSDFGSPDLADALALTYAQEVAPRSVYENHPTGVEQVGWDYDPYEA